MGKLLVLNVVLVLLAVYASALYTYKSADDKQIDEEIDTIARALNALGEADKRSGDGDIDDDDDDDVDCAEVCDEDCNCEIDACEQVCLTLSGLRSMQTRGNSGVEKKFWRRIRIPTPRIPRIPTPRIPRIPRIPPARRWFGKK